ncbi:hypothetical protein IFR05_004181 [Cadophora sp. M221]|nr:hypothetical protein IFR05_004181 [Cadophora sp. M221]
MNHFHKFLDLPLELQDMIWTRSAEYPRYVEVIVKNNKAKGNAKEDKGFVYFKNAVEFDKHLPGGLEACRRSRAAILPLYSLFDLGSHRVRKSPTIEYSWLDDEDPGPENFKRTAVVFNPEWDTVVLQAGYVLYETGVIQRKLPAQLRKKRYTRHSQRTHVKHLATMMFPWDRSPRLPHSGQQIVKTFPRFSTLCVIGHRNEECACGYCGPSRTPTREDLANVKKHVVETLEPIMENKQRQLWEIFPDHRFVASPEKTPVKSGNRRWPQQTTVDVVRIPEVRAIPMNYRDRPGGDGSKEWYGFIEKETGNI